jgi:dihydroflavonol-4-reductase
MATNLVLQYARKSNLDIRVACPTGIIGPYDFKDSEMGHIIKMYLEKKLPLAINGSYDFVDVRDVVNGLLLIEEKGSSGEVYLLPGKNIELAAFFKLLATITSYNQVPRMLPNFLIKPALLIMNNYYKLSKEIPLFTRESVKILNSNSNVSGEKAIKELGYKVRPLNETLKDTTVWLKKQYHLK